MTTPLPRFDSRAFLRAHVDRILGFYAPVAHDPAGGFFHCFLDDGTVYDRSLRHLVSATRWVFTNAMAHRHTGRAPYRDWTAHALAHLGRFEIGHGPLQGLHAWTLHDGVIDDGRAMAYGQAFVLLAMAHAHAVGVTDAEAVAAAFDRMEDAFYDPAQGAYADERASDGTLSPYRGQNANMHQCEACLAAYEATGQARYLTRALSLIERFAFDLASQTQGLVWEHFDAAWQPDWAYNRDRPGDIFKPWGFQVGHQTEWAKLMLIAHAHAPDARYPERAMQLQTRAWELGWDRENGGLFYGVAPDGQPCDRDKYFWVQAESLASAWRLWRQCGQAEALAQYQALWRWSWEHLVDHQHGAWFRVVSADGRKLETTKSPPGKVDYHTMGACWDVLSVGGLAD